jgi:hypothetical protein
MADYAALAGRLNENLAELRKALASGGESTTYARAINSAASVLYGQIAEILKDDGLEIDAIKDNGRVLKIGQVGPLRGTRFPFCRFRFLDISEGNGNSENCELCVVVKFEVSKSVG